MNNDEYTVYGSTRSRAFRVLWTLEELGVPYTHHGASPQSDEVLAVYPVGKIPVLVTEGQSISDSVAIMTFLTDRHGALTHAPGTVERAKQDAFVQAVNDEVDALIWTAARHTFVLPEDKRLPEVKDSLRWEFSRTQVWIADRMEGPYAMGDTLTFADFLLCHCVGWAQTAKFEITDERLLAHAEMMRARPAFKKLMG